MHFAVRQLLDAPADRIVATLRNPDTWLEWMPGLLSMETQAVRDDGFEVALRLRAPRELQLHLDVDVGDDGIRYRMVEGNVSAVQGSAVIDRHELVWDLHLEVAVRVPGALVRELEDEVMPRWLRALDAFTATTTARR